MKSINIFSPSVPKQKLKPEQKAISAEPSNTSRKDFFGKEKSTVWPTRKQKLSKENNSSDLFA